MPPKGARPPRKGSKKDIDAKGKKLEKDSQQSETMSTVFSNMSLDGLAAPAIDESDGRVATGLLVSEARYFLRISFSSS